jgi:phosphate-selective porin OprO/OprP
MDAARQPKLEAKNVRLAYYNERMKRRLQVLDGIDLKLFEGELVAIVGPSGCGKSTFLNAVDGLTKLNSGEIRVDGNRLVNTGAIPAKGGDLWSLEAAGNIRNVTISGEYYNFGVDRDTGCAGCIATPDPAFSGWYVQASWILTGEAKLYQASATNNNMATFANPRIVAPFTVDGQHWGAWELAARYSDLDLNWRQGASGVACNGPTECIRGGEQKIWTLGLNWYPTANIRILFDYAIIEVNKLNGSGQQVGQTLSAVETRLQFTN